MPDLRERGGKIEADRKCESQNLHIVKKRAKAAADSMAESQENSAVSYKRYVKSAVK